MAIGILLTLLAVGIALKSPQVKGYLGEMGIRFALRGLGKENIEILNDITLQNGNKTAQIDHIVIGRNGIFVIETKNYQGWIFGSEKNAKWTQTIYKSKRQFQNPIHQNYGHIKTLEQYLPDYVQPIVSIVAFTNSGTLKKIDVTSDHIHVVQTDGVVPVIKSYTEERFSQRKVHEIADQIRTFSLRGRTVKQQHVATIQADQQQKAKDMSQGICPKCGQPLVARTGKRGSFTGCSAFPKCRFTAA
ncbi:NERD domain-containing protein [Planococcus lenghuensis]|uniref:NERD domain-containing protein n=1 Tax=Planococcus lenghuensis TaxID=2213202 RepID=A0A1Q2L0U2_9BACL|nr:NERD domain-containing protein [Planococcus lenghuensis]AQQ54033.1 hypothetical protein B0X71_13615 [Planococcus lenghuensis]